MGGFWGKFLCVLLGFILGVAGAFGGVVGAGYYIGSLPIEEATTTIDSFSGASLTELFFGTDDEAGLLDAKYSDKYVKDLLTDTTKAIGELSKGGSLQALNNISPKIGEMLDELTETTAKYGIMLSSSDLLKAPLQASEGKQGLTDYFVEGLKNAALGDMLTGLDEAPSGLFEYLCYGEEGEDYDVTDGEIIMKEGKSKTTVKDLLSGDLTTIFNKVPLAAVTKPKVGDSTMLTIAYGRENVTYKIKNSTETDAEADVEMLPMYYEKDGDSFVDYSGAKVEGTEVTSEYSNYVKFQLPTEEGEDAQYLYLLEPSGEETKYFVYEKTSNDELIAVKFSKTKISDLTSDAMGVIDKVLLKDILSGEGEKTNAVLESLCYDKDGNPNSIGQLRNQGGALVDSIPLDAIMTAEADNNLVLYLLYGHKDVHFTTSTVDGKTEYEMLQKFIAIYDGKVYNEYGELQNGTLNIEAKTYTVTIDEESVTYRYEESTTDKVTFDIQAETDINGDEKVNGKDKVNVNVPRAYLFDGDEKVMFEETVLGDFARTNNKLDTITDHLTVKDIFGEDVCNEESDNYNPILAALADSTVGNIGEDVKTIPISTLFSEKDLEENQLLKSLSNSTLETLSTDINKLSLAEILGDNVNKNAILKNLAHANITNLHEKVNELTVEQVLHDQIYYYTYTEEKDAEGNFTSQIGTYYEDKEKTILVLTHDLLAEKYYDATGAEIEKKEAQELKENEALDSIWFYLLNDKDEKKIITNYKLLESDNEKEKAGMGCLIDNMVYNIHEATLQRLKDDELIDFNDSMLGELIRTRIGSYDFSDKLPASMASKTTMGQLTVTEILDYVEVLFAAMNEVESILP